MKTVRPKRSPAKLILLPLALLTLHCENASLDVADSDLEASHTQHRTTTTALHGTTQVEAGTEYHILADGESSAFHSQSASPALQRLIDQGVPLQWDARFGQPTFLMVSPATQVKLPGGQSNQTQSANGLPASWDILTPVGAAMTAITEHASLYGLSSAHLSEVEVAQLHDTGEGGIVVRFEHRIGEIEVFEEHLSVILDRNLAPQAISGFLNPIAHGHPSVKLDHVRSEEEVLSLAANDLFRVQIPVGDWNGEVSHAGFDRFDLDPNRDDIRLRVPARVKKIYFSLPDRVVPAFYLELDGTVPAGQHQTWAYAISAKDGRVLLRRNLERHEAIDFRVWADETTLRYDDSPLGNVLSPHPSGQPDNTIPPHAPQSLVTVTEGLNRHQDPWLPNNGAASQGNNADAFTNVSGNDGFDRQDYRAQMSAPGQFDYVYDDGISPNANRSQTMAAITQAFYVVNFLHDHFYDVGFDEVAGNGQQDNYGRGGEQEDRLELQIQDYSGFNNASMATPSDGENPVMRLYLFSSDDETNQLVVTGPAASTGSFSASGASFGPGISAITGELALVDDLTGTTSDGCEAIDTDLTGLIAVVDRGNCAFVDKIINAQQKGAIGVVVFNNDSSQPNDLMTMGGNSNSVQIPSLLVSYNTGSALRTEIEMGGVQADFRPAQLRDSALDNQIVTHEWGHYLFGRLVNGGGEANQTGSLNEGNSDFLALLMSVKEENASIPGNEQFQGAYPSGPYATGDSYFGIRRAPYSTDFAVNPFTLKHIANNQDPPSGPPLKLRGVPNSEVHNSGEIWANVMWECYAGLLNQYTYAEAHERMISYVVTGLMMFPSAPTFIEARDAFLSAAIARDEQDFVIFWEAFAKRGFGGRASAPDRYSTSHNGVFENYDLSGVLSMMDLTLSDDIGDCDSDGFLDQGEVGTLLLRTTNVGSRPLEDVQVTVTAHWPGLAAERQGVFFPQGNQVVLPEIGPYEEIEIPMVVQLEQALDFDLISFRVTESAGSVTGAEPNTIERIFRANVDQQTEGADTETFETGASLWTVSADPQLLGQESWQLRSSEPAIHQMYGPNLTVQSDLYLTSPPLQVNEDGSFAINFQHRHDFEAKDDGTEFYDGGVVELSDDEGQTWMDVGDFAVPGYNAVIVDLAEVHQARRSENNPLATRRAFSAQNPSYPNFDSVAIDLGETLQGRTVLVRFRIGTDVAVGGGGWEIDDVQFTGIADAPFSAFIRESGECEGSLPIAKAGLDQVVIGGLSVSLDGTESYDPGGTSLQYEWLQTDGPEISLEDAQSAAPSFEAPVVDDETTISFSLVVTSETGLESAQDEVQIFVRQGMYLQPDPPNRAPIADPGDDRIAPTNTEITLNGSRSSDPDGDVLSYEWKQIDGPDVDLDDATAPRPKLMTPERDTTLVYELVVTDGLLASEATQIKIEVVGSEPTGVQTTEEGCHVAGGTSPHPLGLLLLCLALLLRRRAPRRRSTSL